MQMWLVKLRWCNTWVMWAINPMYLVSLEKSGYTHTHIEGRQRQILDTLPQAKEYLKLHKLGEARKDPPQRLYRRSMALPTLWFWTPGLQNHKRIHVHCFTPPSLWCFVTEALGRECFHPTPMPAYCSWTPLLPSLLCWVTITTSAFSKANSSFSRGL